VGFWIWDDPFYGWHVEVLYVPLSVMFAAALARRSRRSLLWGAALVLLREDGAVVACAIHLLHTWSAESERLMSWPGLKRSGRIAVFWFVVFSFGLFVRWRLTPLASARLGDAVAMAGRTSEALAILVRDVASAFVLFGSGLLIAASRTRGRALAAALPLMAVALVASLAYDARGMVGHGPPWVPRFAMFWGIAGAALAFSGSCAEAGEGRPDRRGRILLWCSLGASLAVQFAVLALHKDYVVTKRMAQAAPGSKTVLAANLGIRERGFLACLSQRLPESTVVAAHVRLFAYFHLHDTVWPSYPQNAWRRHQVVVCEIRGQLPRDRGCPQLQASAEQAGFLSKSVRGIRVDYEPSMAAYVDSCVEPVP
jgi:hypothetical protein